jgi:hypothetical protein
MGMSKAAIGRRRAGRPTSSAALADRARTRTHPRSQAIVGPVRHFLDLTHLEHLRDEDADKLQAMVVACTYRPSVRRSCGQFTVVVC